MSVPVLGTGLMISMLSMSLLVRFGCWIKHAILPLVIFVTKMRMKLAVGMWILATVLMLVSAASVIIVSASAFSIVVTGI